VGGVPSTVARTTPRVYIAVPDGPVGRLGRRGRDGLVGGAPRQATVRATRAARAKGGRIDDSLRGRAEACHPPAPARPEEVVRNDGAA